VESERIDIVLVRPARAANVAAACRAMKNMGLFRLRLVAPVPDLEAKEVRTLAYGAWDVLEEAIEHASLEEAVAEATFVAATSGLIAAEAWSPRRLAAEMPQRVGSGRGALVFGPESTGLTARELRLCHEHIHIPSHPAQPSLNLAQAVLVLAYELFLVRLAETPQSRADAFSGRLRPAARIHVRGAPALELAAGRESATTREVEEALCALRESLQGVGYLNRQNPDGILGELRRLVFRAGPTRREAGLLRGLARQLAWAARELERKASLD
jgi:TrmH family RNA methyltransferase